MAIILPDGLPALEALKGEDAAALRDPTPGAARLDICVFNLMPKKLETELQLARKLGQSGETVALTFAAPDAYVGRNAPPGHMDRFYRRWSDLADARFDAVVITGAPIEVMDFEDVSYWSEMEATLDWVKAGAAGASGALTPLLSLCWGAQAALYRYYGVPKHLLPAKRFGIYRHRIVEAGSPFLRGLTDAPAVPVSRWTETREADLAALPYLKPLLVSETAGLGALADEALGHLHVLNHFEYDALTLDAEYRRDLEKGSAITPPEHYYPGDDMSRTPEQTWGADADAFYGNWVRWLAARQR